MVIDRYLVALILIIFFGISTNAAADDFTIRFPHSIGFATGKTSTDQVSNQLNGTYFSRNNSLYGIQVGRTKSDGDDIDISQLGLIYGTDPLEDWTHLIRLSSEQSKSVYWQRSYGYTLGRSWNNWTLELGTGVQNVALWNETLEQYSQSWDPTTAFAIEYFSGNWSIGLSTSKIHYTFEVEKLDEPVAGTIFSDQAVILATGLIDQSADLSMGWAGKRLSLDFIFSQSRSAVDASHTNISQIEIGYNWSRYSTSISLGRSLDNDESSESVQFIDFSFSYSFRSHR